MRSEITIRAECMTPERLIERSTACGARFDSVRLADDGALIVTCDAASARHMLSLCERFCIPARVTSRRGRAAIRRFFRERRTLPAGIAVAVLLCALFLSRVWMIDISLTGDSARPDDMLALSDALEALEIRRGVDRRMNTELIAQALLANAENLSYVGVHLQGVRLSVEAVSEVPSPPLYDVNAARDLVSGMNGVVIRAIARSGEVCVKTGDVVQRGQLLIRGEELSGSDETRPIAALGEVLVRAWYEGEAILPVSETRRTDTGSTSTGASLAAFGFRWPIKQAEEYPSQRVEREYLPIGGLFLPIEIERETRIETRETQIPVETKLLKNRLMALALADAALALSLEGPADCAPRDSWVEFEQRGGALWARAVIEIQTNAAVTREALQGG